MALDRRITIQQITETRDDFGETQETVTDLANVWAERRGAGSVDVESEGGVQELESVTWTVRFTTQLAALTPNFIQIMDSELHVWNVEGISESDSRRCFLTMRTVREI